MEPDDDEHDGDDAIGPLLPPDDRLWRHPSEVFAGIAAAGGAGSAAGPANDTAVALTSSTPRDSQTTWLIAVVSGLAGAIVVVSIIGLTVGFGTDAAPRTGVLPSTLSAVMNTTVPAAVTTLAAPKAGNSALAAAENATVAVRDRNGTTIGVGVSIGGGYVLTAAEVAASINAENPAGIDHDGVSFDARVLGASDYLGVGLLQIDDDSTPAAPAGSVMSIGASNQISIMSASGPVSADLVSTEAELGSLYPMLSVDAPEGVEPGSAVLDDNGNVIGILTGKADAAGHALAIPIDIAKPSAVRIMSGGSADCGWLGVQGHSDSGAVELDAVAAGSPAEQAGLKPGDRIVVMGNSKAASIKLLGLLVRSHGSGESMRFTVKRGDQTLTIDVILAPRVSPS
ncbi:MAG: S1C family serine protease [Acidimicrobiia bacterium]